MKTEVVMKRELWGQQISQKSKSGMFSATDLVRAGNRFRITQGLIPFDMSAWLAQKGTKEFIRELEKKFGVVKISGRGRGKHTWIHPLLFIDMALAISPKLKIEVYQWLFDHLLELRNDSGDSYKEMCGYLYTRYKNKREFPAYVKKVALAVKKRVGVDDWQLASEEQLNARDRLYRDITLLTDVMTNTDVAVRIALQRSGK